MKRRRLLCQECGGCGEVLEDQIDFGGDDCGPILFSIYASCGWCKGKGTVTPKVRGLWLSWKKEIKRERARYKRGAFAQVC